MVLIIIFVLWSFIISLYITISRIPQQLPSKRKYSWIYIGSILSPFIIGIVISCLHQPLAKLPVIEHKKSIKTVSPSTPFSEQQFQDSLDLDFFDYAKHLRYMSSHFNSVEQQREAGTLNVYEPDAPIINYYLYKTESLDTNYSKVSHWALGILNYYLDKPDSAIRDLKQYETIPYTHLFIGLSFRKKNIHDSASCYYLKEYKIFHVLPDTLMEDMINRVIKYQRPLSVTTEIVYTPELSQYIPDYIKKNTYFTNEDWIPYFSVYFRMEMSHIYTWEFLIATLVSLIWLIYLLKLDVFQKEKWQYLLMTILLSMTFTELVPIGYDYFEQILQWKETGNQQHDFIYCVFGIGMLEEVAKIIPLLLLMAFTQEPDENYDYLLYASISALTFAWLENSMYFAYYGGTTIVVRTLTSTVAHVFFSSLVAYGLVYAKHFKKNRWLYGFLFFLFAIISHGLYDWFLLYNYNFLFNICFFGALMTWFIFLNNTLNTSRHFSVFRKINFHSVEILFTALLGVVLISQYIVDHYINRDEKAIQMLWVSVIYCLFFLLFYVGRIGKMDLVEGYWRPITFRDRFNTTGNGNLFDLRVLLVNFFVVNAIQPKNYFGMKVNLYYNGKISNNAFEPDTLISGVVTERVMVNLETSTGKTIVDPNYFWIHLDQVIKLDDFISNAVLVKQVDNGVNLETGIETDLIIWRFYLPDGTIPRRLDEKSLYFSGYCLVQIEM